MPKPDRSNYSHVIDLRGKQNTDNYLRAGWDDNDFSDAHTERRNQLGWFLLIKCYIAFSEPSGVAVFLSLPQSAKKSVLAKGPCSIPLNTDPAHGLLLLILENPPVFEYMS